MPRILATMGAHRSEIAMISVLRGSALTLNNWVRISVNQQLSGIVGLLFGCATQWTSRVVLISALHCTKMGALNSKISKSDILNWVRKVAVT